MIPFLYDNISRVVDIDKKCYDPFVIKKDGNTIHPYFDVKPEIRITYDVRTQRT